MTPRRALRPFPNLPMEIVSRILHFALYSDAEFSSYLQRDDMSGHRVDFASRQQAFMKSFATVSKPFYRLTIITRWRYIFIASARDLKKTVYALDNGPFADEVDVGGLCLRIELRISGNYDYRVVVKLLTRTPNVRVFILRNQSSSYPVVPDRECPDAIVTAVATHASALRRVQFETRFEEPSLSTLQLLLISATSLITLHVDQLAETLASGTPKPISAPLPRLEVISLGNTMRQPPWAIIHPTREDILPCFQGVDDLPSLRGLYVQRFSPTVRSFLTVFGCQLRDLGFSCADRWVSSAVDAGHLMEYCPNLVNLTCICPEGPAFEAFHPLPHHPIVTRVNLITAQRGAYIHLRSDVVQRGLSLLHQTFPSLVSAEIAVPGPATAITLSRWFRAYRRALRKEGVCLQARAISA